MTQLALITPSLTEQQLDDQYAEWARVTRLIDLLRKIDDLSEDELRQVELRITIRRVAEKRGV